MAPTADYSTVRGSRVAIVMGCSDDEAEANAALVAGASELFEALERCRWALVSILGRLQMPVGEAQCAAVAELDRVIEGATAAIRAASPLAARALDQFADRGTPEAVSLAPRDEKEPDNLSQDPRVNPNEVM